MQDIRQTESYAKYMELLGWKVFSEEESFVYVKELFLLSIAKCQRSEELDIKKIDQHLRYRKSLLIFYIEPANEDQMKYLQRQGFTKINSSSIPSKTIRFDLSLSEKVLLSQMHHKARYNIGLAIRRGIQVITDNDIKIFADFWQQSAKKRKMYLSLQKEILNIYTAFKENADIIWAEKDGQKLAGVLVLYTKQAGYYMYAASTDEGNKHHAPSLLVWEAVKSSRKRGLDYFDLEGIYDERFPLKSWKGFSKFKKSFGGEVLTFPGSMRKIYMPFINN